MKTKTDLQRELPGTWLCFQNKIWLKQQKTWPILTTKRIGAQKTKARKTNCRSTEYVQGRQRKQSQQNCTPSCKKVGLTLTKISSFQKRRKKDGKKETCKLGGFEFTPVCNQKSLKFHSDDLSKRCWGIENRKPTHPKPWKWWQFIKLYHKQIITAMNVYLPFLSCINKEWIITPWGFRTSYCSCALSMCFYGWRGLGPPIVHLPSLRVSMDGGWGFPVVHVPSPCNSMDGGLGLPIVHVPSPCVSMDGV